MNGPSGWESMDAVPRRTNLPDALVTGRAVDAVRGVLMACSTVPGRPLCVPGRMKPVVGRPVRELKGIVRRLLPNFMSAFPLYPIWLGVVTLFITRS